MKVSIVCCTLAVVLGLASGRMTGADRRRMVNPFIPVPSVTDNQKDETGTDTNSWKNYGLYQNGPFRAGEKGEEGARENFMGQHVRNVKRNPFIPVPSGTDNQKDETGTDTTSWKNYGLYQNGPFRAGEKGEEGARENFMGQHVRNVKRDDGHQHYDGPLMPTFESGSLGGFELKSYLKELVQAAAMKRPHDDARDGPLIIGPVIINLPQNEERGPPHHMPGPSWHEHEHEHEHEHKHEHEHEHEHKHEQEHEHENNKQDYDYYNGDENEYSGYGSSGDEYPAYGSSDYHYWADGSPE